MSRGAGGEHDGAAQRPVTWTYERERARHRRSPTSPTPCSRSRAADRRVGPGPGPPPRAHPQRAAPRSPLGRTVAPPPRKGRRPHLLIRLRSRVPVLRSYHRPAAISGMKRFSSGTLIDPGCSDDPCRRPRIATAWCGRRADRALPALDPDRVVLEPHGRVADVVADDPDRHLGRNGESECEPGSRATRQHRWPPTSEPQRMPMWCIAS